MYGLLDTDRISPLATLSGSHGKSKADTGNGSRPGQQVIGAGSYQIPTPFVDLKQLRPRPK